MRTKIGALVAIAVLTLALGASSSASRAAIVENIINTDIDPAVGSITFPTPVGSSDAGVLFSYDGFTQANITSISGPSIRPPTMWSRSISMPCSDDPCPNGGDCSNRTVTLSPTLAQ